MKEEEQRIAIAEFDGYKEFPVLHINDKQKVWALSQEQANRVTLADWIWSLIPDYLHDLNAMHEVEKKLADEQQNTYAWHCIQLVDNYGTWSAKERNTLEVWEFGLTEVWFAVQTTASQRAEALLRTIGKWKES